MVHASHLAITSPSLLGFVRAYLWQLERTGAVPDQDDAPEQQAAKEAAHALFSSARDRDQRNRLFTEFKQFVEQPGQDGQPSERLQAVLHQLRGADSATSAVVNPVDAVPSLSPAEVATVSVDTVPSSSDAATVAMASAPAADEVATVSAGDSASSAEAETAAAAVADQTGVLATDEAGDEGLSGEELEEETAATGTEVPAATTAAPAGSRRRRGRR